MKKRKISLPDKPKVYTTGCEYYFSCNLRSLRLSLFPRMSQARLAKKLGVARSTLAAYESGRVKAPGWFIHCTAEYFNKTVDELLQQEMEKERKKKQ